MSSNLNGRVLHIGKYFPPFRGGMEAFLADLIEEQRKQGLYAIGLVHGQPLAAPCGAARPGKHEPAASARLAWHAHHGTLGRVQLPFLE